MSHSPSPEPAKPSKRKLVAAYNYTDAQGVLSFQVVRYFPKSFRQRRPDGAGGWIWDLNGVERILYNLPAVLKAGEVVVTEGERDASLLTGWGLVATTNSGGAGKWRDEYAASLKGKAVVVLFDDDEPGRKHVLKVAASLLSVATSVKVVELSGSCDVSAWADKGGTKEALMQLAGEAKALTKETLAALHARWLPSAGPPDAPDSQEATLASLAALPRIDYERRRHGAADELGIRVHVLDAEIEQRRPDHNSGDENSSGDTLDFSDPEPWPDPVNGKQLLDGIADMVKQHVVLSPRCADAVALWILFAHCHDRAGISPILTITSPASECGKTTLLTIISALVPHPLPTSNITPAALFRSVEKWKPTLLIDEADSFLKGNEDLRGILDSGHSRAQGYVLRVVGDNYEVHKFSTWCPKALASIGRLAPTLMSRSILIPLQRKRADEKVVLLRPDKLDHLVPLLRQAWRWSRDHSEQINDSPTLPVALHGRPADNWRMIVGIADLAGGRWPDAAREAALTLGAGDDTETASVLLLADVADLFSEQKVDRLPSAEIVAALAKREDRPWPEWSKGKPITTPQFARLLRGFKINPQTIRFDGGGRAKGYHRDAFTDALSRYSPSPAVTTGQTNRHRVNSDSLAVTSPPGVTAKKGLEPPSLLGCHGVTARKQGSRGEREETSPQKPKPAAVSANDAPPDPAAVCRKLVAAMDAKGVEAFSSHQAVEALDDYRITSPKQLIDALRPLKIRTHQLKTKDGESRFYIRADLVAGSETATPEPSPRDSKPEPEQQPFVFRKDPDGAHKRVQL